MHTTPEGTETMQNTTALAAATAHLVDTDQPPATFRARTAETGAGSQQRARAEELVEDGAREHTNNQAAEAEREATRRSLLDDWKKVGDLHRERGTYTPAVENFYNEVALLVSVSPDPAATFDTLLNVISSENAKRNKTTAECPVWPGICTDTAPGHFDHFNHEHRVLDKSGNPLLDVGFVQLSDLGGNSPAKIYVRGEDFAPEEIPAKTAELRRLLDTADAMAEKVLAIGKPEVAPHSWAYTLRGTDTRVDVTCPPWCENTHEMDQYSTQVASDIYHQAWGQERTVEATDECEKYEPRRLLSAQLAVIPDSELGEAERAPHVRVEVVDELWTRAMGRDELAEFIGTVEGQLTELRKLHTRLVQVRAETA
ncbi:hypothetical protein [Streptomyces sp. NBC_00878]|uniref:DUF6907 domain-containing protein n=1 Tax=Streptomyces sp. NBC_00878 TaxID=2975854 RepID=UPI00225AF03B|nr:hypothetical protein [Streptomyces sp. NBC_00878]MCX4906842.1 hypothetical protein [Streptomyces sp. NBC_00878]